MAHATALSINALRPYVKDVSQHLQLDLYVKGVHCGHCIHKIQKILDKEPSVSDYQMDESSHNLSLFVDRIESFPKLIDLINGLGFESIPIESNDLSFQEELAFKRSLKQLAVAGVCAGNIMLFSTAIYLGAPPSFQNFFNMLSFVLAIPVLFYSAEPIWRGVLRSIRVGKFNLDLPIGLAVAFGFVLSVYSLIVGLESVYFDSITVVIFIILCSRFLLDRYVKSIYRKNIAQCIPGVFQARVLRSDGEALVAPDEIQVGEKIRVLRSETCPVDGELMFDSAIMDLSVLTGESEPQVILKGNKVYAGSILCADECVVKVSQTAEKTRVGQLVEASLKSMDHGKEESYRYVSFFTVLVVAISFISFISFFLTAGASVAFQRAFAIIIVACPCAVSFGIPLIRMLSGQLCLKNGILVKKPQILTEIPALKHICFDKTGTLTESKVDVSEEDFKSLSFENQNIVLSLELEMDHPISNGFKKLREEGHELLEVSDFEYRPSEGVVGIISGQFIEILSAPKNGDISKDSKKLYIYRGGEFVGSIKVSTSIKKTAQKIMDFLALREKKISLLSGDHKNHVESLWKMIPHQSRGSFLFQVNPEEKEKFISEKKEPVMMVGDGINDIAAIKKAAVGVTLPGALENNLSVSDISLLKGDLSLIERIYRIADRVKGTEKNLLVFTSLYNSFCIGLAIFGLITPVAAAILMPISSFTVLSIVMLKLRKV